jgi:hypothetical protein
MIGVTLPGEGNQWHSKLEFVRQANTHPFSGVARGGNGSFIDQQGILEPQITTPLPLHTGGPLFDGSGYARRQAALKPDNPVPAEPRPSKVPVSEMGRPVPHLWYSGLQNPV